MKIDATWLENGLDEHTAEIEFRIRIHPIFVYGIWKRFSLSFRGVGELIKSINQQMISLIDTVRIVREMRGDIPVESKCERTLRSAGLKLATIGLDLGPDEQLKEAMNILRMEELTAEGWLRGQQQVLLFCLTMIFTYVHVTSI